MHPLVEIVASGLAGSLDPSSWSAKIPPLVPRPRPTPPPAPTPAPTAAPPVPTVPIPPDRDHAESTETTLLRLPSTVGHTLTVPTKLDVLGDFDDCSLPILSHDFLMPTGSENS